MKLEQRFKNLIRPTWHLFSDHFPKQATQIIYFKHFGRFPNLKQPKRFTEKLEWLKLYEYSHNPTITNCVDKYAVRKYVQDKGCGELLNNIIGYWTSVEEIPWNDLPSKFALKCTHGCGYNIICDDKSKLNISKAQEQLKYWMSKKYDSDAVEMIYDEITPGIICEDYIESDDGLYPVDYKLFCSYGEAKIIYVLTGRTEHDSNIDYFTPSWKWIPVKNGPHNNAGAENVRKPKELSQMIEYAKKLSADFPFARVDFYCEKDVIRFGEITFLPTGGLCNFNPISYDIKFGKLFPIKSLEKRYRK